jgi:hypothetical protein
MSALKEQVSKHNTAAALRVNQNTGPIGPAAKQEMPINPPSKTSSTLNKDKIEGENLQTRQMAPSKTSNTPTEAEHLGLVATWSIEFGYISLHDLTSGEWHDIPTKEAPSWATWEARKRKELYKGGNRKAYRLTCREMEKVWEAEQVEIWDTLGITDRGILYEDYLEEDA